MSVTAGTEQMSLQLALRRLWSDHVIWTREYVVAAIAGAPDASAVAARLLANQEHIGSAVVPFYGQQAGEALTGLLKQHIMVAVDLIEAAKTGDQARFAEADRRWDENAREIASLLSSANPNWSERDLVDLLSQHLKLTKGVRADVDASAMDAVRQWTYKPYLLNGDPTEVETTITVVYTLGD